MPNDGNGGGGGGNGKGEGGEGGSEPNSDSNSNSGPLLDPISIVISQPPAEDKDAAPAVTVTATAKGFLPRNESYHEQCRVCQQQAEEPLIDLGCRCRGELAKAHLSCIQLWFQTRGSNKCEICQQVAANVPSPESQPSGCLSPLWVAFAILIGGLLLDVLISVSLGVSALPVNIIIGVLIVLGLGTAFRLALECCQEWGPRRHLQRADMPINPGYHPAV